MNAARIILFLCSLGLASVSTLYTLRWRRLLAAAPDMFERRDRWTIWGLIALCWSVALVFAFCVVWAH